MEFNILPVLSPEEVARFVSELSRATFVDGKATAFGAAREIKHNLQAERSGAKSFALDAIISSALQRNNEFQSFAFPKRILPPSYARYEPGMHYGSHIDGAVM